MNTKNKTQFPQTVEIPQPLEVHPSVSAKAAVLLEAVIEVLMREPKRYDQWACSEDAHTCGGANCILGWAAALNKTPFNACEYDENTAAMADRIGLTEAQAESIYHSKKWPTQHANRPTSEEGIARIEHFLRTGE